MQKYINCSPTVQPRVVVSLRDSYRVLLHLITKWLCYILKNESQRSWCRTQSAALGNVCTASSTASLDFASSFPHIPDILYLKRLPRKNTFNSSSFTVRTLAALVGSALTRGPDPRLHLQTSKLFLCRSFTSGLVYFGSSSTGWEAARAKRARGSRWCWCSTWTNPNKR